MKKLRRFIRVNNKLNKNAPNKCLTFWGHSNGESYVYLKILKFIL